MSAAPAVPVRPRVMAIRHPIDPARGRVDLTVPIGSTVARMVEQALPNLPAAARSRVRVIIGTDVVPADRWHLVRPKPHVLTIIKLVGGSGQTANVLRVVVTIAAIAVETAREKRNSQGDILLEVFFEALERISPEGRKTLVTRFGRR